MARKSPIRHNVRASTRKGRRVTSFDRGSGQKTFGNPHFEGYAPPPTSNMPSPESKEQRYYKAEIIDASGNKQTFFSMAFKGQRVIDPKIRTQGSVNWASGLKGFGTPRKIIRVKLYPTGRVGFDQWWKDQYGQLPAETFPKARFG